MVKKIGLFGGSFNPIHNTHIKLIKDILNKKIVNEVWIMPCRKHAFDKELTAEKHRVSIIKLAIKNIKNAKICYIELKTKKKNYTIETIRKIKKKYNYEFFYVVGSDILYEIKKWQKYKQLLKEVGFIVFKRKGYPIKIIKGMRVYKRFNYKENKISSTEIRKRVREGKSLKGLVPEKVEEYIENNKIYK